MNLLWQLCVEGHLYTENVLKAVLFLRDIYSHRSLQDSNAPRRLKRPDLLKDAADAGVLEGSESATAALPKLLQARRKAKVRATARPCHSMPMCANMLTCS